jgi:hypothetical protein
MYRARPSKKGSFGGHLEELVRHFPHEASTRAPPKPVDKQKLKEKLDIHALLFERAWQLDRDTSQFRDVFQTSDGRKARR